MKDHPNLLLLFLLLILISVSYGENFEGSEISLKIMWGLKQIKMIN